MKGQIFDTIKKKGGTLIKGLGKASPELLIAGGIIMMGVACVKAVIDAKDAYEEVDEKEKMYEEKGEEMSATDKAMVHAKHQAVNAVMFGVGAAAVVGANSINKKRNMALALALQAVEASNGDLQGQVKKLMGKERVEEAKAKAEDTTKTETHKSMAPFRPDDVILFKDEFTGISFYSTEKELEDALKDVNKELWSGGTVSLKQFYDTAFIEEGQVAANNYVGWNGSDKYDGFMVEFIWEDGNVNGKPCRTFKFSTEPTPDFIVV